MIFSSTYTESLLAVILICVAHILYAQQGIGTDQPNKASALEIKSSAKGLLIPRVALQSLNDLHPINGQSGNASDLNSLLIYNTAEENDVNPGYYYWSFEKQEWQRLLIKTDLTEMDFQPWLNQDTGEKAMENTEDIYQKGHVAVGKSADFLGDVALDIEGSVRTGKQTAQNVGAYSFGIGFKSEALGDGTFAGGGLENPSESTNPRSGGKAKGESSFSFGYETLAEGDYSTAFGYKTQAMENYTYTAGRENRAEGIAAIALGRNALAKGNYSVALGKNTQAEGYYSLVMGRYLKTKTGYEIVFGRYNVNFSGSGINSWHGEDPLFVVGNGTGDGADRNNALTILKDGRIGMGIDGNTDAAKPSEMLDIGKGKVRIRALPQTKGSAFSDSIVTVNSEGVLKSINPKSLKTNGPWFKQNTDKPTNNNGAPIYQTGAISIGKNKVISGAQLDVEGSIHGGITASEGDTKSIGENSIGVGEWVISKSKNTAVFGYKSEASDEGAFAAGGFNGSPGGKAKGRSSFAFGHNAQAEQDFAVAFGQGTQASGKTSAAFGKDSKASDYNAFAVGNSSKANGNTSLAMGRDTQADGNYSAAFGHSTISGSAYETVLGRYNKDLSGSKTTWNNADPLLQIGNGTAANSRANALTVLKDGWVGIGFTKPQEYTDAAKDKSIFNEKLSVAGSVFVKDSIYATHAAFPDYVFKSYYGALNSGDNLYEFKPLEEIERYIKRNHHLPGMVSVSDLPRTKTKDYIFNLTGISIGSLEKIEELFLYLIEQQDEVKRLQQEVEILKKDNQNLKSEFKQMKEEKEHTQSKIEDLSKSLNKIRYNIKNKGAIINN